MGLIIFKSITTFLKNHVWCLIVYFSTITLVIWGTDSDLANRAGFASSIVSIVLAIVVIVFTMQESGRMQRFLEQLGKKVEKVPAGVIEALGSGSGVPAEQSVKSTPTPSDGKIPKPVDEQAEADILKYYTIKGMDLTNVTDKTNGAIYSWGWAFHFNLFNGSEGFKFHGYFPEQRPNEIMFNMKQLMKKISDANDRTEKLKDNPKAFQEARNILDNISIDVLVAEGTPKERMSLTISKFQPKYRDIPFKLLYPSDIKAALEEEYENIGNL